jgi:4-amino-4-deoxy-L-arabinose transferase-like glycosyltransferase
MDGAIAALSGIGSLAVYVRTMAPDLLYGDSAELQTLAHTLGHTHSTGYPIYLLLAHLVGFLPLHTPAWRVTLFSALSAASAVAGAYLVSRMLTNSRTGAVMACVGLALSYTLWAQAIIAEVYAPGAAFLAWILFLALRWHRNPEERGWSLFAAALLAGLSLGVHATAALAALPAAGFVLLRLILPRASRMERRRALLAGGGGAILGVVVWLAAFLYIDWHDPSSSFINTTLAPSRSIWGLAAEDMDSPVERIFLTVSSVQWKDVLFAGGARAACAFLVHDLGGIIHREFSGWFLLLGLYCWWVLLRRCAWDGGCLLASILLVFFSVLNYHPGGRHVFFLSTYIPCAAVAGAGMGALIDASARWRPLAERGWGRVAALVTALLVTAGVITPAFDERLPATRTGVARFVAERYQFPVKDLREPRRLAEMRLSVLPDDALVLMKWRDLHAVAYLAYVEAKKPSLLLVEAMPRGHHGRVAASMIETIRQALADGRSVYTAQRFPGLEDHFTLAPAANQYVQILPKE